MVSHPASHHLSALHRSPLAHSPSSSSPSPLSHSSSSSCHSSSTLSTPHKSHSSTQTSPDKLAQRSFNPHHPSPLLYHSLNHLQLPSSSNPSISFSLYNASSIPSYASSATPPKPIPRKKVRKHSDISTSTSSPTPSPTEIDQIKRLKKAAFDDLRQSTSHYADSFVQRLRSLEQQQQNQHLNQLQSLNQYEPSHRHRHRSASSTPFSNPSAPQPQPHPRARHRNSTGSSFPQNYQFAPPTCRNMSTNTNSVEVVNSSGFGTGIFTKLQDLPPNSNPPSLGFPALVNTSKPTPISITDTNTNTIVSPGSTTLFSSMNHPARDPDSPSLSASNTMSSYTDDELEVIEDAEEEITIQLTPSSPALHPSSSSSSDPFSSNQPPNPSVPKKNQKVDVTDLITSLENGISMRDYSLVYEFEEKIKQQQQRQAMGKRGNNHNGAKTMELEVPLENGSQRRCSMEAYMEREHDEEEATYVGDLWS